ncbi:MAG: DUF1569 domain-containing protein [Flavobacteriaceae bacterium]
MEWKNLFDQEGSQQMIDRIEQLQPDTQPQWGKMNSGQMLAHCNVAYDLVYTDKYPKLKGLKKIMIKMFAKGIVTGPKPYKKNMRTSPIFLVSPQQDFENEKNKIIAYIKKTQELGGTHFNGKESYAFGKLTEKEWNTLFSKHLEHHLQQFGV